MKGKQIKRLWLFAFAADFAAIAAAYYATLFLRFRSAWGESFFTFLNRFLGVRRSGELGGHFELFYQASALRIIVFLTITICILYALRDLYTERRFIRRRPLAWNVVLANGVALILFYSYFYLRRNVFHPRSIFATVLFLNVFFCVGFRVWMQQLLDWMRERWGVDRWRAVLVGESREADYINSLIEAVHPHGLDVVRRLRQDVDVQQLESACVAEQASMLICAEKEMTVGFIMQVLELGERLAIPVKILSERLDVVVGAARMPADRILGVPLVHFDTPGPVWEERPVQRILTLLAVVFAAAAAAPLMGLIALVIRITSPGKALFVQERIGVNRKPFRMLKFRTMHDRAEEIQAQVEEFNDAGRGLFKMRTDPRVTPVGRALRRFSMDELPQLINVLRGEMVFVGPRPLPRRDFESYYEDWHYSRHAGMPGLTCLWQVSGRSELDFHNMCVLDVYYLRNQSWVLDVKVLLRTVWVVLFAKGAY